MGIGVNFWTFNSLIDVKAKHFGHSLSPSQLSDREFSPGYDGSGKKERLF